MHLLAQFPEERKMMSPVQHVQLTARVVHIIPRQHIHITVIVKTTPNKTIDIMVDPFQTVGRKASNFGIFLVLNVFFLWVDHDLYNC